MFINSDMTLAEQRAAYELRCRRRQARQRSQEQHHGPDQRQHSTGPSARGLGSARRPTMISAARPPVVSPAVAVIAVDDGDAAANGAGGASTAAASSTSSTIGIRSAVQSSVLSPSAPAFVSFIPSAPVATDGSRRADGADARLPPDGNNQLPSHANLPPACLDAPPVSSSISSIAGGTVQSSTGGRLC